MPCPWVLQAGNGAPRRDFLVFLLGFPSKIKYFKSNIPKSESFHLDTVIKHFQKRNGWNIIQNELEMYMHHILYFPTLLIHTQVTI